MKPDVFYGVKLSADFKGYEFRCRGKERGRPCACRGAVSCGPLLLAVLQSYRSETGFPVHITVGGGLRCEVYNEAIGGFIRSYHIDGMAADITSTLVRARMDQEAELLAEVVSSILDEGQGNILKYPNNDFIHVDVGLTHGDLVRVKGASVTS